MLAFHVDTLTFAKSVARKWRKKENVPFVERELKWFAKYSHKLY